MSSSYQAYPDPHHAHPSGYTNAGPNTGSYPQAGYNSNNTNTHAPGGHRSDASVGPAVVSPYSPNLSPHFSATAGMLILLSMISLYEGVLRTIQHSRPAGPWTDSDYNYFPAIAVLIGGILESLYSLISLFVGLWALLFDWHSITLTTVALITQMIGWYTVIVFSLAEPAFFAHREIDYSGQLNGPLSVDQNRAAHVFGWIFSLFAVNTAVLAGLIFFTIQLLQIQMNKVDELHSPFYYARRLRFWLALQLLLGVSQIIYAAIIIHENTATRLNAPIYFYPNVTSYSIFPLITGFLFTVLAVVGLAASCIHNLHSSNMYIGLGWITFLWVVAGHVMGSCGLIDQSSNSAGFGMSEMGVLFGTLLIPMFLSYKAATIETVHRGQYNYGPMDNYNNRPIVV